MAAATLWLEPFIHTHCAQYGAAVLWADLLMLHMWLGPRAVHGDDRLHFRNMQVDRSNAERAADSEKLMAGIRSRAAGYGNTAGKSTGRLE
jgi:hypothetical protein